MAGLGVNELPALLVGQMSSSGTAVPNVPVPCSRTDDAARLFGLGSMLERMVNAFLTNNAEQQLWALPIPDPSAGVAAHGSIAITSPATVPGTYSLYVGSQVVPVYVGQTDSTATVAANVVAAINAMQTLPVTAALHASGSNVVDVTCKWNGATGNDIMLSDSYLGILGAQYMPVSMAVTYSPMQGGTGVPDFTAGIASLGDELYEYVALPYTDTGSLVSWQTEYGFAQSGRWGWMRQLYGQIYSARRGAGPSPGYSDSLLWGPNENAGQTSVMAVETNSPSSMWEWAAAYCANAAMGFSNDPARPLQTLALLGILPAPKHQRFKLDEMNQLASVGLATQAVNANGQPYILRETSTYQVNAFGSPDTAYTDMTSLATLSALLRNQRQRITTKFPRYKLADDGTTFGPGQAIVTPKIIKAELVAEYALDEFNGLVEDADVFARNLIVERDSRNPTRVNVLYPPNLISGLRIFAVLAQFRLMSQQQTPGITV